MDFNFGRDVLENWICLCNVDRLFDVLCNDVKVAGNYLLGFVEGSIFDDAIGFSDDSASFVKGSNTVKSVLEIPVIKRSNSKVIQIFQTYLVL